MKGYISLVYPQRYGTEVCRGLQCFLPNANELVAGVKDMWAIKHRSNIVFRLLTGVLSHTG